MASSEVLSSDFGSSTFRRLGHGEIVSLWADAGPSGCSADIETQLNEVFGTDLALGDVVLGKSEMAGYTRL